MQIQEYLDIFNYCREAVTAKKFFCVHDYHEKLVTFVHEAGCNLVIVTVLMVLILGK